MRAGYAPEIWIEMPSNISLKRKELKKNPHFCKLDRRNAAAS